MLCVFCGKGTVAETPKVTVTKITDQTGPWNGYKITTSVYEFWLKCTNYYGLSGYELTMEGEKVVENPGFGFSIYDDAKGKYFFNNYAFRPNGYTVTQEGNKVTWELVSNPVCEYSGTLEWTNNKITLTHHWLQHEEIPRGRVITAVLKQGIPLLTNCRFKAVLNDNSVVEGSIPADLPEAETVYAGGKSGKAIKELTFFTKKGQVKISFLTDKQADLSKVFEPQLMTRLHKELNPPFRRYELVSTLPAGPKDVPRSYTIIFEFPEN